MTMMVSCPYCGKCCALADISSPYYQAHLGEELRNCSFCKKTYILIKYPLYAKAEKFYESN